MDGGELVAGRMEIRVEVAVNEFLECDALRHWRLVVLLFVSCFCRGLLVHIQTVMNES